MIRSMTGYGHAETTQAGCRIAIDVKSVNHRYLETTVRMNREWMAYEDLVRKKVQSVIGRGRVDVFVTVEREQASAKTALVDWALADSLMQAAEDMKKRYDLSMNFSAADLFTIPDLIHIQEADPLSEQAMEQAFSLVMDEALAQLSSMREQEGMNLHQDLSKRLGALQDLLQQIDQRVPVALEEMRGKLRSRIEMLMDDTAMDEYRLMMEVAIMAERTDVSEELTRLSSHFKQFEQLLNQDQPIGRKMDFLIQEMNREINTIGSKASDSRIAGLVVDMKAELEKMREQVQNIE